MHRKSFFSTQPFTFGEFIISIRAKMQFRMSFYMATKIGHITKAFTSGLFAVKVGVFLFITINLLNMAAKSNFRQAYAFSSIAGNIIVKICSKTVEIF